MRDPHEVLRNVFHHEEFRPLQGDVVNHVCEGGSAIVLFPTGKGKSLCYQIPAICRDGVGIVVSPLISLMRDQIAHLEELGVVAATINSTISASDRREIVEALKAGQIDLLYVTPEQVATARFQSLMKEIEIALVAVDEAHCISTMGADFRTDYNVLGLIRGMLPDVPIIAATATADEETLEDMKKRLDLADATIFRSSFDRANIHYTIAKKSKKPKEQFLAPVALHKGECGIVYCIGRNTVDKTAALLRAEGYSARAYHAGMTQNDRDANQDAWFRGDIDIIVATVAFGMGIDKADVRYVIHTDMPASLEALYQESGRAGRDGLPARSYVFYGNANVVQRQRMLKKSQGGVAVKRTGQAKLDAQVGVLETTGCRRKAILHYFGEQYGATCDNCDNCEKAPKSVDATAEANLIVELMQTGYSLTSFEVVGFACNTSPLAKSGEIGAALAARFKSFKHDWAKWSSVLRQMVAAGVVSVSYARQAELALNPAVVVPLEDGTIRISTDQTLDSAKVRSTGTRKAPSTTRRASTTKSSSPRARSNPYEAEISFATEGVSLLSALRRTRAKLARAEKKKEYFVFHNETLEEIARIRPRNGRELLAIKGVGPRKVEQYGTAVFGVVNQYAEAA